MGRPSSVRSMRKPSSMRSSAFTRPASSGSVDPYTVHYLRRTWRSWAGDLGIDFEVAERNLGHALGGVAGTYARGEMLDRRAHAADVVAKALDACRGALPAAQQHLRVVA